MGCTTGAKIFDNGQTVIVFKNKDFEVESHSDRLAMEQPHAFGVRGADVDTYELAGLSIGVNQHGLVAVNSHVLSTPDEPYDLVTERIVLEAKTVDEAIAICEEESQGDTSYQWCNMVVATPEQLAAIELTSSELATARSSGHLVRTNHHHLLLNTADAVVSDRGQQALENSEKRSEWTKKMLENASGAEEILTLLKSHDQGAAICRHGQATVQDLSFTTVYSYLVTVHVEKRPRIFLDVVKGPPCELSSTRLELAFPLTNHLQKKIHGKYPF